VNAIPRIRPIIDADSRPFLPRHVRLHFDPLRQAWALLSPEKILWPDAVSLDILRLCDGERTAGGIISALADEYEAPIEVVGPDVLDFFQEWSDRMLVRT
jgi:pyrroloquinoline quinone biosynthesis protein D